MTENKRFTIEGIDEEICQIYDDGNCIGTDEVCDLLNEQNETITRIKNQVDYLDKVILTERSQIVKLQRENERLVKMLDNVSKRENERLVKMLDNVSNYVQREHREMLLDDFVEWWNNIATDGLEDDNGVNENKIRKRKVKADGRVDYVGISKEDLE